MTPVNLELAHRRPLDSQIHEGRAATSGHRCPGGSDGGGGNNNNNSSSSSSSARIGSLALVVVHASGPENCLYSWSSDGEEFAVARTLDRAHARIRSAFPAGLGDEPRREASLHRQPAARASSELGLDGVQPSSSASSPGQQRAAARAHWYPAFVTRYILDCERASRGDSLCRSMRSRALAGEPRLICACRDAPRGQREDGEEDLVGLAAMLIKLRRYLRHQTRRASMSTQGQLLGGGSTSRPSTSDKVVSVPADNRLLRCDKAVQCCKSTEFLKVSPNLKFYSRSSLVINVDSADEKPGHRRQGRVATAAADKNQPQLQLQLQQQQQQRRASPKEPTQTRRARGVLNSPSLEYVAHYRPELRRLTNDRGTDLRSFSSSAIFGLERETEARRLAERTRESPGDERLYSGLPSRSTKPKRPSRSSTERLRDTIRRAEDELLRCANFVEDDLASFQQLAASGSAKPRGPQQRRPGRTTAREQRRDLAAAKKVLLEDYITEVKEIVRSESLRLERQHREARIMRDVKLRLDEDLSKVASSSDSWQTAKPSPCKSRTSYLTASESRGSSCCCRCSACHWDGSKEEEAATGRGPEGNEEEEEQEEKGTAQAEVGVEGKTEDFEGCRRVEARRDQDAAAPTTTTTTTTTTTSSPTPEGTTAKSSHSVDSGVLLDFPRAPNDWQSSDDGSAELGRAHTADKRDVLAVDSTSSSSCNDEALCQKVESAVRKFTEELILCERRARNRSRSRRRLLAGPWSYSQGTEEAGRDAFDSFRNTSYSSDDEHITEISTPSLVSLSDCEVPPTSRMPT